MKKQPRGIRNNNPGNINKGIGFQGEVAGNDSRFATFASPELGIRALTKNLMTYDKKYGLNTVQGIINRWAPPNENNTSSYVNVVAKALGVNPTDKLNMRDPAVMAKLASSIIQHENGQNPYTAEQINAGVNMALGNTATPSVAPSRQPGLIERVANALIPAAQAVEPQTTPQPQKRSMADRIAAARNAGYSDDEIIQHLSNSKSFVDRLAKAREAGYSDEEVYKHFGLAYQPKQAEPTQSQSPQLTSQVPETEGKAEDGGFWDGVWMGIRDPLDAGAQMLSRALDDTMVGRGINSLGNKLAEFGLVAPTNSSKDVDKLVNEANERYEAGRKAAGRDGFDWARLGGNVAGTLPLMATGVGAAGSGAGLGARIGIGAAQGASFGSLQPVIGADKQANFYQEKGKQAALGGLLGGATPVVLGGVGRVLSPKASRVGSTARSLLDEGVELTPGQALGGSALWVEDKLMSVPIMGDAIRAARIRGNESLNRAVYNRVLEPIGQTTNKIGREAVDDVAVKISNAYDDVLNQIQFEPDKVFSRGIDKLKVMAKELPEKDSKALLNILEKEVETPLSKGVSVDGRVFKRIESQLGKKAIQFLNSTDAYQKDVGHALAEAQKMLRNSLMRGNSEQSKLLKGVNYAYAAQTRLQQAANRVGAENGVFTPEHLLSAIRSADNSVRKNAFARGNAMFQDLADAAKTHMSSKIPNSGTFDRMATIGTAGATAYNPLVPVGLGLGAVPYLPGVSKVSTGLLTSRPEIAHQAAQQLNRLPNGLFGLLGDYRN